MKHAQDNAANSLKEAVQERPVIEKEVAEFFINSKNTVPVYAMNELKGHRNRAFVGILYATSRAKAALAAKGNELHIFTMRTDIHGTAKGGIPTVNHPANVFDNDLARMKDI